MSLNFKVTIVLAAVLAVIVGLGAVLLRSIIVRSFEEIELRHAKLDLERFAEALRDERKDLEYLAGALAAELDAPAADSEADPLSSAVGDRMQSLGADFLCLLGPRGALLTSRAVSRAAALSSGERGRSLCEAAAESALPAHDDGMGTARSGLADRESAPLILAATPVRSPGSEAGAPATLIVGRVLDPDAIRTISQRVRADIDFWPLGSADLELLAGAAGAALALGRPIVVDDEDTDLLQVYTALPDITGSPAFLVRANLRRDLREAAMDKVVVAVTALALLGLAAIAVSLLLVRFLMVGPLSRLTAQIVSLRRTGERSARLEFRRRDEIGILADAFNGLLDDLADAMRGLTDASYRAGRAEMAEGILHNLRNVLTSLSVTIHGILGKLPGNHLPRMGDAISELAELPDLSGRGRSLIEYLRLGFAEVSARQASLNRDIHRAQDKLKGIETILKTHAQGSQNAEFNEHIPVPRLVRDAMTLLPESLRPFYTVHVGDSVSHAPPVLGRGPATVQVLANLLVNAVESIQRAGVSDGAIEITAEPIAAGGRMMVDIRVRDNGTGISGADLTKIFQRDYSTKSDQGRGIGLHWSANLATSMRGELYAESEGPGRGACLHLVLPAAQAGEGDEHRRL